MFFKADVIVTLALALAFVIQVSHGYDVLMVVGGMYVENSIGYTLKAVEVIGLNSVCQVHILSYLARSNCNPRNLNLENH